MDEVKLLTSQNESLRDAVDALKGDVETLKEDVKTLLKIREKDSGFEETIVKDEDCSSNTSSHVNSAANEGNAANKKKKKKKKGNRLANDWGAAACGRVQTIAARGAPTAKIAVCMMSIALLVSIALGQGIIGIGKKTPAIRGKKRKSSQAPPLIWEQRSRPSAASEKANEAVGSTMVIAMEGETMAPVKSSSQRNPAVPRITEEVHLEGEKRSAESTILENLTGPQSSSTTTTASTTTMTDPTTTEELIVTTEEPFPTTTELPEGTSPVPDPELVPPTPDSLTLSSSQPAQICQSANKIKCGCEVVQGSDYRGTIDVTEDGFDCERWDSKWLEPYTGIGDYLQEYPRSGLQDNNFCRNPGKLEGGPWCQTSFPLVDGTPYGHCNIPKCDPCSCRPQCGERNKEVCACPSVLQANTCCKEEDARCKCRYLKDACTKSLENNRTDFCDDAEVACCNDSDNPNCKCNMYENICFESPGVSACDHAADKCCETAIDWHGTNSRCLCDFYTYSAKIFSEESERKTGNCSKAKDDQTTSQSKEKVKLKQLYNENGGEYWIQSTEWLDDSVHHCEWFGIKCNRERFVVEINLRSNNITGKYFTNSLAFPRLTKLDIAENELSGEVTSADILYHQRLVRIDISRNQFTGHADMSFPPSTLSINYSHNKFASVGFKKFNPAHETLRVVDLSNNRIDQEASELFFNIPPNLEKLVLTNNVIKGALPDPFPLRKAELFAIANNAINGSLPDFPTPLLRQLDLSNQNQIEHGGLKGSLTGTIRRSQLEKISVLNLGGNKLSGDIPSSLGDCQFLRVLNLSSNAFVKSIPKGLGKLKEVLEVLDVSNNKLLGSIPKQLAQPDGAMVKFHLRGNTNLSDPAPLDLCFLSDFDIADDTRFCPPERNALREFYVSAKGGEWTESSSWLDPFISHCDWFGIRCSNASNVIKLELHNNGLSGKLSEKIELLSSLEVLDLSDNRIKGTIPKGIGNLANLKYVRLCYNGFIGNQTNFGHLQSLELIQVHGNRLSGTIPRLNLPFSDSSSFVSDCGSPSDFNESLVCEDCSMCCNAQGDCYPTEANNVKKAGFHNYMHFSFAFIAFIFVASGLVALAVFVHDKHKNRHLPRSSIRQPAFIDRDKKYALSTVGADSVYQFFLGKSFSGWFIVLLTMAVQICILFIFVGGSEIDWTHDRSDLVYTWKCPRDQDECRSTNDLDLRGWLAFIILMVAHLSKDIINGTKLIVLSAKQRHSPLTKARFFIGGTLLATVSTFTFYVSTIYNAAIATDNRAIIENSVIILFICDIDELLYDILMVVNQEWVKTMSQKVKEEECAVEEGREEQDDGEDGLGTSPQHEGNQNLPSRNQLGAIERLEGEMQSVKTLVAALQETVKQQNDDLKKFLAKPQDPDIKILTRFLGKQQDPDIKID